MPFKNRTDAGRRLAQALLDYREARPVVLALPRGGVPVAAEVAAALDAPLDIILVRKVGVPMQLELAMGAVVAGDTPTIVRNEDVIRLTGVEEAEFAAACDRERLEIERRRKLYLAGRDPIHISGRVVIVIDDGIATGATTRAALRALRRQGPRKLILAVPVAATDSLAEMRDEADEIVCLESYESFGAIGVWYSDFRQISDQEVIDALTPSAMANPRNDRSVDLPQG